MAVNLSAPKNLLDVSGVQLGTTAAGIKYADRDDLLLLYFAEGSITSGVFTRNIFSAAPVQIAKQHLQTTSPRAFLINSGNANAVTGDQGLQSAIASCEFVANKLGVNTEEVLPFSTGVIGEQLPMSVIKQGVAKVELFAKKQWLPAAKAIMTTDTLPKAFSRTIQLANAEVTITGIAKGSGMICPDMATMLAYVVTDACVSQTVLDEFSVSIASNSFNAITVDSDTSTNDAFMITATQQAGHDCIDSVESADAKKLYVALEEVAKLLAQSIIRDGEGATKFIEINAYGGVSQNTCSAVAYCLAHSPLVKTAFFASDPNWGRLLMAIGKAPVDDLEPNLVSVSVNKLAIVTDGQPDKNYTEAKGQAVFNEAELVVDVKLGVTEFSQTVWTSDLSHEYVSINADYRS